MSISLLHANPCFLCDGVAVGFLLCHQLCKLQDQMIHARSCSAPGNKWLVYLVIVPGDDMSGNKTSRRFDMLELYHKLVIPIRYSIHESLVDIGYDNI